MLSTCRFVSVPLNVDFAPAQRCSRPTLPASWMTHSAFFTPGVVELLTGGLAGERLALADVGDRAELLPLVDDRS